MVNKQILIAEPSPAFRIWLRRSLGLDTHRVKEVTKGWEVLWHLAEAPCDLVIVTAYLDDIPCPQLLAMIRTAGLRVPVLLVYPDCPTAAHRTVIRAGSAAVVEDVINARILRSAVTRLVDGAVRPASVKPVSVVAGSRTESPAHLAQASGTSVEWDT